MDSSAPHAHRINYPAIIGAVVLGAVLAWSVPLAIRAQSHHHPAAPAPVEHVVEEPEPATTTTTSEAPPVQPLALLEPPAEEIGEGAGERPGEGADSPADTPAASPDESAPERSPEPAPSPTSATTTAPPAAAPAVQALNPLDFSLRVIYAFPQDRTARPGAAPALAVAVEAVQRAISAQTGGRTLRFDRRNGAVAVDTLRLSRDDAALATAAGGPRDQVEADLTTTTGVSSKKLYVVFYDGTSPSCVPGAAPRGSHVAVVSVSGACGTAGRAESAMAAEIAGRLGPSPTHSVFVDPPSPSPALPAGW